MRWILASIFLILFAKWLAAATTTGLVIQGGKVVVQGGIMAVGPSQQTFVVVASTGGQPIGMLMGLTYSN